METGVEGESYERRSKEGVMERVWRGGGKRELWRGWRGGGKRRGWRGWGGGSYGEREQRELWRVVGEGVEKGVMESGWGRSYVERGWGVNSRVIQSGDSDSKGKVHNS